MTETTVRHAPDPLWVPDPKVAGASRIAEFARRLADTGAAKLDDPLDYTALWRWSVDDLESFWAAAWDYIGIRSTAPYTSVLTMPDGIESARWFDGAHVNFAEHALSAGADDAVAVITVTETAEPLSTTWAELRRQVAALADTLRDQGVGREDSVVGYLPVGLPALVGLLATTSIGAVWAQCAQDYSAVSATDRLGQLSPTVLIAADGYTYRGQPHDRRATVGGMARALPALRCVVTVPHAGFGEFGDLPVTAISWTDATAGESALQYADLPFDHPLWALFTSGTTGIPKGILHGHGGVTVALATFLGLHFDLGPDDVFLQYSSTNWMMWNVSVAALLSGATTVLYDGSPVCPDTGRLWRLAADLGVTALGTSPGYLQASENAGIDPGTEYDLSALRLINSTGSALPPHSYRWVQKAIGDRVQLSSTSGGTDVVGAFAGTAPTTPVWPGELSAPCLGVDLQSWDDEGRPHTNRVGELVVTAPMPSMPLRFVGDPDGRRYHDAYFAHFPGVWRHGDWVTVTDRGTVVLHGRSDSTLNRRGVRLGTAEIYGVVDGLDSVEESLVLGVELPDGDYWMPMFVVSASGVELTAEDERSITEAIRSRVSPRHVPDQVIEVRALPHTKTGKRVEVPLKRILQGANAEEAISRDALDDPDALDELVKVAEERLAAHRASDLTKG